MIQLRKACSHPYLFPGIEPEPYEEGEHLVQVTTTLMFIPDDLGIILPGLLRRIISVRASSSLILYSKLGVNIASEIIELNELISVHQSEYKIYT